MKKINDFNYFCILVFLIFLIFLISNLIGCSNKINHQLEPTTSKSQAEIHADIVKTHLIDDTQITIIGVNYLYYFGYTIYALHKHNLLDKIIINRLLDILPSFYKDNMHGLYSYPNGYINNRTATRDDLLGIRLALWILYKYYNEQRAYEHLKFMVDIMNDSEDPYIPIELRKENEPETRIVFFSFFDDTFIEKLIDFYQSIIIKGLDLDNDIWSPYHRNCFNRSLNDSSGNQEFWDMANYYAGIKHLVSKEYDSTAGKLLAMSCMLTAREINATYWSIKADNYLHDNIDMNKVINIYYANNSNEFMRSLGQLLLGTL